MRLLLFLFLLLSNCTYSPPVDEQSAHLKIEADTIVAVNILPAEISSTDYAEKEYYLVVQNDTSNFSGVLSENNENQKLSLHYVYTYYGKTPARLSSMDTAAVGEGRIPIQRSLYDKKTYTEQVREIKLMLSHIAKQHDLEKLERIWFLMDSFDGLSENITKQYISQYGKRFPVGSNQKIAGLVKDSH